MTHGIQDRDTSTARFLCEASPDVADLGEDDTRRVKQFLPQSSPWDLNPDRIFPSVVAGGDGVDPFDSSIFIHADRPLSDATMGCLRQSLSLH